MSGARVVVTGGCGFVGSHLVELLRASGDEVTVFDSGPPVGGGVRYVRGDIRDGAALATAIRPGVDVVYHLAAVVGVDNYLSRPLDVIDINFAGTRQVLDLATRAGARVVVVSTSEVFGKNPAVPWTEDADRVLGSTSATRWTYSTSKALAEHLTFAFVQQHGLDATIVRYFNVYGPRQRPAYVLSRGIHRALNGRPPLVYDDGRQTRCFTYVADAVEGTLRVGRSPQATGQAFNLGSTVETSVGAAVELVGKLCGTGLAPEALDTGRSLGSAYEDVPRRIPDTTKARTMLGWTCDTSLETGLRETIAWARTAPEWLALPDP